MRILAMDYKNSGFGVKIERLNSDFIQVQGLTLTLPQGRFHCQIILAN
jgi:hypothetical protein